MSEFLSRIRKKSLHKKVMEAEDTVRFFKNVLWKGNSPGKK